ncbi:MAG TPA: SpoIIE family protein phosphatase [Holophaga sp.]|nr:SpoIIE family protein phosphatase [Holophaga sp.]
MSAERYVIEIDHFQVRKHKQDACGDVFQCLGAEGGRMVSVLADGLGSGIKANVLANLTATMAARYVAADADITRAARIIMETLPVCSLRQIAYSTFTIVDMDPRGSTRIAEYDNPTSLVFRYGRPLDLPRKRLELQTTSGRPAIIHHCAFQAEPGDRVVVFSDGVTQSGMGQPAMPLGWEQDAVRTFLEQTLARDLGVSARCLARALVQKALVLDGMRAKDDITCGVISYRKPRQLLVLTGPPVHRERDRMVAEMARDFQGRKVVCGGSTANLVARELGLEMDMNLRELDPDVPPMCSLAGFDLVTEGAITLATTARMLEEGVNLDLARPNAATCLASILLDSDVIQVVAGTKINEALQDPNLPAELDIRRNILRRIQRVLETKYFKDVRIRFV